MKETQQLLPRGSRDESQSTWIPKLLCHWVVSIAACTFGALLIGEWCQSTQSRGSTCISALERSHTFHFENPFWNASNSIPVDGPDKFTKRQRRHFFRRYDRHPGHFMITYQTIAVLATVLAVLNSGLHIFQHMCLGTHGRHMKSSVLQILLVVPIFSICSCVALMKESDNSTVAVVFNAVKEAYAAIVLIAFMLFVAELWGGGKLLAKMTDAQKMTLGSVLPSTICSVQVWEILPSTICSRTTKQIRMFPLGRAPGSEFIVWTFVAILQYSVVMFCYVGVHIAMYSTWINDKTFITRDMAEIGCTGIKLVSSGWASYNLSMFKDALIEGLATKKRMERIQPKSKWFCINFIALFATCQQAILKAMIFFNLLAPELTLYGMYSDRRISAAEVKADAIVNFLVCMEMLLFAQWHRYAYPHDERACSSESSEMKNQDRQERQQRSYIRSWLRHSGAFRLADDIFYLKKRVSRQKEAINLIVQAKNASKGDLDEKDWTRLRDKLWHYFSAGLRKGEVSIAQLQYYFSHYSLHSWDACRKELQALSKPEEIEEGSHDADSTSSSSSSSSSSSYSMDGIGSISFNKFQEWVRKDVLVSKTIE